MLVTASGAGRLVLPALVLVLLPIASPAHQSPAKHHPANIVRLLNTPEHKLDDAAIWEVAAFLSNYTRPSEGNLNVSCPNLYRLSENTLVVLSDSTVSPE